MNKKCLIVGSTGGTGSQLIKHMLNANYEITAVVRNANSAKTVLKEYYEKIKFVECQLGTNNISDDMKEAVKNNEILISTLGPNKITSSKVADYDANLELIKLCEELNPKINFIFITSMFITRPYTFISFLLNNLVKGGYVLGYKALAENRLRQSKLNYLIIRPGGLTNNLDDKTVNIYQGDRNKGYISRHNLAKFVINAIENKEIDKGKVTVEVVEEKVSTNFGVKYENLKLDDESSIVTADHFRATSILNTIVGGIFLIIFICLVMKFK